MPTLASRKPDSQPALLDGPILGKRSQVVLDMVDATSLLWRLCLLGIDIGDRWLGLADRWAPMALAGHYAFNDVHAAIALIGAGRTDHVDEILRVQRSAMDLDRDNAVFTRDVGHPLTLGLKAFAVGDYSTSVERLRSVREIARRFGGSHAQRDVIDLTLIEAAIRAGQRDLAQALTAERSARRSGTAPHPPVGKPGRA